MSIQDNRCDDCGSHESWPFIGHGWCFCRRCAGKVVQSLLRYIRGFDRDHPRPKKPRNVSKPIVDSFGKARCRDCETALDGWKQGDSPRCESCNKPEAARALSSPVASGHDRVHPWGPDAANPPALHRLKP